MRDTVLLGDVLEELKKIPDGTVQCCVTSPPYWGLRDYGHRRWFGGDSTCDHSEVKEHGPHHPGQVEQTKWKKAEAAGKGQTATTKECIRCGAWYGQLGLEPTPQGYVAHLVEVFREVRRVLRDDGTFWLNLGDSYSESKNLLGIPWRVAFALQDDGWILRSDVIWSKGNAMPESVRDRPTRAHEYIFLLTKNSSYFYDRTAILEPVEGHAVEATTVPLPIDPEDLRNRRSVWSINSKPYRGAHFAVFPEELPETCIRAGSSERCCATCGTPLTTSSPACHEGKIARCVILDPFAGSGTTLAVAVALRRSYLGVELNPEYHKLIEDRLTVDSLGVYSPSKFKEKQEEFDNLPWE